MHRRQFLRFGAIALAGAAVAPARRELLAHSPNPYICEPADLRLASSGAPAPFTRALPIPSVAAPSSTAGGVDRYTIPMRTAQAEIVSGMTTEIYGYAGVYPGPTIAARRGRPVEVEFVNELPVDTSIHLHGGHVAPDMDGHPEFRILPGGSRLYRYPNDQPHSTLWYHDHAMHETAENVYRGLAGLYLLTDDEELALDLPSGEFDVPLLLQDRSFNADGSLFYPSGSDPRVHDGFVADILVVNGVAQPFHPVKRTRYRFRLVNGANTRPFDVRLSQGTIRQIASDGGLLASPVAVPSIVLGVAERAEIVVDFADFAAGSTVELQDALSGRGLVRFDVQSDTVTSAALPAALRSIAPLGAAARVNEVVLAFDDVRHKWVLNGQVFDPDRIDFRPRLGQVEHWRVVNDSHFVHPFHLHLAMFQVVERERNGIRTSPPMAERGWKDTVRVGPGETVTLAVRFDDFTGTYLYHCHILEHEDHSMMAQFRVVDLPRRSGAGRVETAAAISEAAFAPNVDVAYVATGEGFADALAGGPAAAANGAPVLLTVGTSLPAATEAELRRLAPASIVVLGGHRAVPPSVEEQLRELTSGQVRRLAGATRYDTAAAVALDAFPSTVPVVYVATGATFPDALGGGAAAAAEGGPLLLTERDVLPDATRAALDRLRPARLVVLGGEGAVSRGVADALAAWGTVERRAGQDRYETAAVTSAKAFPSGAAVAYVATGEAFPDALAGVPAAAGDGAPLLLVSSAGVPPVVVEELRRLAPRRIVILGGTAAVPASVEDGLAALL